MDPAIDDSELTATSARLRRLARALVSDEHAAEDLAQDTLVRVLESPPRNALAAGGWARRVLRNLVVNRARAAARRDAREARVARAEADGPESRGAGTIDRLEVAQAALGAVLALREPYRTTVRLRFFDDLPPS